MTTITIDKTLKREIKARRLPINQLAQACCIPTSVLHGWVNGTLPSAKNLHHIRRLAEFLGISIEELLFGPKDIRHEKEILFSSTFVDGDSKYRFLIEKIT